MAKSKLMTFIDYPPEDKYAMCTGTILEAEFHPVRYYEDVPDICSLPVIPDFSTTVLGDRVMYDPKTSYKRTMSEKLTEIASLKNLRIPLPYYQDLAQKVYAALTESYSHRVTIETRSYSQEPMDISVKADEISTNAFGLSVIGISGSGKSSAMSEVLKTIPKCIRVSLKNGMVYHQVPVVPVTAYASGGLRTLLDDMADYVDRVVDAGGTIINRMKKEKTIAGKLSAMKILISTNHIGLIVIDEAQFFDFSDNSEKSFQSLITLSQSTGVALAIIGTEDTAKKLEAQARLGRRFVCENLIRADNYCKQEAWTNMIILSLWYYQWSKERQKLTSEITDAITRITGGNISMIVILYQLAQEEIVSGHADKITPELLQRITDEKLNVVLKLMSQSTKEEIKIFSEVSRLQNMIVAASSEAEEDEKRLKSAVERQLTVGYHPESVIERLCTSIGDLYDFTPEQIRDAYNRLNKKHDFPSMTPKEISSTVLTYLQKGEKRKKIIKVQENEDDTDLDDIEEMIGL